MTTTAQTTPPPPEAQMVAGLVAEVAATADHTDSANASVRSHLARLSEAGLAALGAPANRDGRLPDMATVIADLAGVCLSTSFSLWAHRMTLEYLRLSGTPWADETATRLAQGTVLGVTGMASAFKELAGCGSLDLTATPIDDGWSLSGTLRWASNLHPDSVMVTAARAPDGRRLIVGVPLDTPGIVIGEQFDLLAMGGTDSSYVTLTGAPIASDQVLTEDFEEFLRAARPTFLVLQTAMCLGLARRSLDEAGGSLEGVNSSLAADIAATGERWDAANATLSAITDAVGGPVRPYGEDLLRLRLDAADVAVVAAGQEVRTAGGRGYARQTDVSRRYREAAFLPVQSPSETQLRWELARARTVD
ncbi:acyl-CoA/acyl-ACP dehydrogenase [Nocardioides rotundus]|uniref:acyl-CoA dehydrogenase family protein n=1 Tax=Nocardioides rotundus TaxID=1774216 RepID=UPI001CC05D24|nr:acyl-CoA dehydrogenase family protein [Nocardioides rotundus]UAL28527.1 acyl-CoA/acyl-ACP dehydrogenase [Nocardioides rotundus]